MQRRAVVVVARIARRAIRGSVWPGEAVSRIALARNPGYSQRLSAASRRTLNYQGGAMSEAEARVFETNPAHAEVLRLRAWDEAAKEPELVTAGIEHYRALMRAHLEAQQ